MQFKNVLDYIKKFNVAHKKFLKVKKKFTLKKNVCIDLWHNLRCFLIVFLNFLLHFSLIIVDMKQGEER